MRAEVQGQAVYAYTGGCEPVVGQACVVLIHGAAQDHSIWALQSRYLAHHGRNVLAFDLPGHGRSAGEAPPSVEAGAEWLAAALAATNVSEATVIGHSLGALIALELASRYPHLVRKLVLVGAAAPMAVSDALLAAARDDAPAAIRMITQWSHAPARLLGGSPVPGLWLPGANSALMRRAKAGVLHRDLLSCRNYVRGVEAAREVICPTLLLCGDKDLMTPLKSVAALTQALSDARTVVIEGAGHAMLGERPDACLDALRQFLAI